MGLRISRRVSLGDGWHVNVARRGVSLSKRTAAGTVRVGRRGVGGSVRIARGVSWRWR